MKGGKNGSSRSSGAAHAPRAAAARAHEPAPSDENESGRLAELVESGTRYVKELVSNAKQLLEIQAERKKLALKRGLLKAGVGLVALIAVAAWLGSAVGATVRGLCAGLAVLFGGRVWLGDLVGGLLALALLAAAVAVVLKLASSKDLKKLEAKYGRLPDDDGPEDAGRVPRPDRSGDATADRGRDPAVR